jgi:MoaA/NifB/PqqE/SkfB family radical SAM enzyme
MDTLELVHLQLTWQCNLRCPFCGQWGTHGFAAQETTPELTLQEWLNALAQIENLRRNVICKPDFILWGGEPLLSPAFPAVADYLHQNGHRVAVVTNGSLLSDFADIINTRINTFYLSVDGPAEVHDRVRNQPGLYEQVRGGLQKIDRKNVTVIGLFTLCEANRHIAVDFPLHAAELGLRRLIVQNLIHCTGKQAQEYQRWIHEISGQSAPHVESWITESLGACVDE